MSVLEQLATELGSSVSEVREALQASGEPLVPNYLTQNPDGTTGADFTGRVHAQGLDLDAGSTSTPPDVDRIRWLRTSDGAVVAYLKAWEGIGDDTIHTDDAVEVGAVSISGDDARARMRATKDSSAYFEAADTAAGGTFARAQAGGFSRVVIDSAGSSSFALTGDIEVWTAWQAVPYDANGIWGNGGPFLYRTSSKGVLELQGAPTVLAAHTGVLGGVIGTLPVGARPLANCHFPARLTDVGAGNIGETCVSIRCTVPGQVSVLKDLTGRVPVLGAGTFLYVPGTVRMAML